MPVRKIVLIDHDKCNGCGLCVPGCHEGAIQIIEGKARLVADNLCDGLGDCLKECPLDAIRIIEREAEEFDEEAVQERLIRLGRKSPAQPAPAASGCPGSRAMSFSLPQGDETQGKVASQLAQWPVQLHLVSPQASYFQDAHLLIAADCVPFAFPEFHRELLKGKALAIACPKLDDTKKYVGKLSQILASNNIQSVTVVHMEVPCCSGLVYMVKEALQNSGSTAVFRDVTITIQGEIR